MIRFLPFFFPAFLLLGGMRAQETWSWIPTKSAPSGRFHHAMAYDSFRKQVILFGGEDGFQKWNNETWAWDGKAWTRLHPAHNPPPWVDPGMAFDSWRKRVVLCLRDPRSYSASQTWEWNGKDWIQAKPPLSPKVRSRFGMAFDSRRGKTILVERYPTPPTPVVVWEWDGKVWTQRKIPFKTPVLVEGLVYDSSRGRTLLVSKLGGSMVMWLLDSSGLTLLSSNLNPPERRDCALVYDSDRDRVVLFGGASVKLPPLPTVFYEDTWEWDGMRWLKVQNLFRRPRGRYGVSGAYDQARGRTVIFGGSYFIPGKIPFWTLSDTWEYYPLHPAVFTPYGSGCPGTAGIPALSQVPGRGAWIGENMELSVSGLPSGKPAILVLGPSKRNWGPLPLPFDLGPLGMKGCSLYTGAYQAFFLPNRGGRALWSQAVPGTPGLVGGKFYSQGLVFDPGANLLGLTTTNGGEIQVGSK